MFRRMGRWTHDQVQETEMFNYDRFARIATATVGALALSTLSIVAAVGPVQASDFRPAATASAQMDKTARG
jgi:hypothetical protein